VTAGAVLNAEDPRGLLPEELVQQRRKRIVREVPFQGPLREATYQTAAVKTATTTMPVATGSASIPPIRKVRFWRWRGCGSMQEL